MTLFRSRKNWLCVAAIVSIALCAQGEESHAPRIDRGAEALSKGDLRAALEHFDSAIQSSPNSAGAYRGRGLTYAMMDALESAVDDLNKAINLDPKDAEAYRIRGTVFLEKGDSHRAIADLSTAVELDSANVKAYWNRSQAFLSRREWGHAIDDLSMVIRLDPANAKAHRVRSQAFEAAGRHDDAIADLDQVIRLNAKDAKTFDRRGRIYLTQGDSEKAISDFTEAIRISPDYADAYVNRAGIWINQDEFERAVPDLVRAISLEPDNTMAHQLLGSVHAHEHQWEEALAELNTAVRSAPGNSEVYCQRGAILAATGNIDQAIEDFTTAIRLDPADERAYSGRAACYVARQEHEKAIDDLDAALKLNPDLPCCYERRGAILVECGDYDRGMADIQTAVRLNPADLVNTFDVGGDVRLLADAIAHGQRQVEQMLMDRPAMQQYGIETRALCEWAASMFAREDAGQRVLWDAAEPSTDTDAMSRVSTECEPGRIRVRREYGDGPDKGKQRCFEDMWLNLVFELYNIGNGKEIRQLTAQAEAGELSRSDFATRIIEAESRAAEHTRAFYICVFLPWAKEHQVATHPSSWFVGSRSDPRDNLLRGCHSGTYRQYYEHSYDLITLRSFLAKGKYQESLDVGENVLAQSSAPDVKVVVGKYCGYCQLRLNRPIAAIDTYSRVIALDPRDSEAYQGRASAYALLSSMDRAIADSSQAIRLRPLDAAVYTFRAKIYEWAGDEQHAQEDFAMAMQLSEFSKSGTDGKKTEDVTRPTLLK